MLPILGSNKRSNKGLSRRDLLQVGGLGLFGLGLSDLLRLRDAQASALKSAKFGRAKACILVYLFGAPPQHETFDPKPDAPVEIQGQMKSIPTCVPGVRFGEGLPRLAGMMDKLTVVRSLTHPWPFHHVHYAVSGNPNASATVEADPNDRTLWPFMGSVVDYLEQRRGAPALPPVPRNIALPFRLYSKVNFKLLGGPYAGFLGSRYDPVWTEFSKKGTKPVPNQAGRTDLYDPYAGIRRSDKFELAGPDSSADLTPERVGLRRSLLGQFDSARNELDKAESVQRFDHFQELAYSILTSPRLGNALDVDREPLPVRERFGMTLFGQSLLAARRLVEAGSQFVTVIWDAYGHFADGWDTHHYHYPRLKQFLLPGLDQSFSALILDLEARGLLDETLVLCLSEHGRTPKLNSSPGGGRDHWSRVYSTVFAGGGMAGGKVVGQSDSIAGDVRDTPVSPKDVLATAFHLLGIDPHTTVPDRLNRPVPIAGEGTARPEFWS
ncbi:MAG: DUF1501 domain-containing protein [Gemmataceae bacterium]|nr:DUF1501 domain-containing protein [Gemmataceae bacterium]